MVTYRISLEPSAATACAFDAVPCGNVGLVGEITLLTLRLLLHEPDARFVFVRASGWQYKEVAIAHLPILGAAEGLQNNTWENPDPNDTSVLGLIMSGEADFSEFDMYLDVSRPVARGRCCSERPKLRPGESRSWAT